MGKRNDDLLLADKLGVMRAAIKDGISETIKSGAAAKEINPKALSWPEVVGDQIGAVDATIADLIRKLDAVSDYGTPSLNDSRVEGELQALADNVEALKPYFGDKSPVPAAKREIILKSIGEFLGYMEQELNITSASPQPARHKR